jgi:pimeloyl-ACP methyl ester carboxylesterase
MIVMAEDGVRIRVLEPGLGDPVLLIPDWLSSGMFFEALAPSLEVRGLCPLRYDPRGSGRSDRPEYGYSLTRDAEDAALVAEAVVGQGVVVAGHGYGARVAIRLSLLRPDLVRGLILMAPSVTGTRMETWHAAIEDERRLSDLVVTSMSRPIPPQDTAMLARDMAHTTRSAGLMRLGAMAEEVGALPASVAIGVVAGEFDGWTPIGIVRRTFQDRVGDRWRLMAASGHYLAWEDPEALAGAIEGLMHPAPPEPAVREDETGSVILVEPPPDDMEPTETANGLLEEEADPIWPWEPESPGREDATAPDRPPSEGR